MKLTEKLATIKNTMSSRALAAPAVATAVVAGSSLTAFAAGESNMPNIAITEEMLTPLVEGVVANIGVVLPVGLGLFAIFLGIRIIPSLIKNFAHI